MAIRGWDIGIEKAADAEADAAVGGGAWTLRVGSAASIDVDEIDGYGHARSECMPVQRSASTRS